MTHKWVVSQLGHGELQCFHCRATNREIAAIGDMNHCHKAPSVMEIDDEIAAQKETDLG